MKSAEFDVKLIQRIYTQQNAKANHLQTIMDTLHTCMYVFDVDSYNRSYKT